MIITLCGSTRFKEQYVNANERLTLAGHVVFTVAMFGHADAHDLATNPTNKMHLDLVHFRKIMLSDAIVVVTDTSRYVGESTRREIAWAKMLGKEIYDYAAVDWLCDQGCAFRHGLFYERF